MRVSVPRSGCTALLDRGWSVAGGLPCVTPDAAARTALRPQSQILRLSLGFASKRVESSAEEGLRPTARDGARRGAGAQPLQRTKTLGPRDRSIASEFRRGAFIASRGGRFGHCGCHVPAPKHRRETVANRYLARPSNDSTAELRHRVPTAEEPTRVESDHQPLSGIDAARASQTGCVHARDERNGACAHPEHTRVRERTAPV